MSRYDQNGDAGFTLAEVLASLLILSLLISPVLAITSLALRNHSTLSETRDHLSELDGTLQQFYREERASITSSISPVTDREEETLEQTRSKIEVSDSCRYDVVGRRCR